MNKEKLEGFTRHLFTFLGGVIVMRGYISEDIWAEITGIAISVVGLIWSIKSKEKI